MARRPARPVALDELRAARAQLRQVNIAIGRHVTGCGRCALARQDTARYCDAGWDLAKQQARAAAAVRRYTEPKPSAPIQGVLF